MFQVSTSAGHCSHEAIDACVWMQLPVDIVPSSGNAVAPEHSVTPEMIHICTLCSVAKAARHWAVVGGMPGCCRAPPHGLQPFLPGPAAECDANTVTCNAATSLRQCLVGLRSGHSLCWPAVGARQPSPCMQLQLLWGRNSKHELSGVRGVHTHSSLAEQLQRARRSSWPVICISLT